MNRNKKEKPTGKELVALKAQVMLVQRDWLQLPIFNEKDSAAAEVVSLVAHLLQYRPEIFQDAVEGVFGGVPPPSSHVVRDRLYKLASGAKVI